MAKKKLKAKTSKGIILPPVRPDPGLEAEYRRRLMVLIDEMTNSTEYWVMSAYRNNEPLMAQDQRSVVDAGRAALLRGTVLAQDDALPANVLKRAIEALTKRWYKKFDKAALELGEWFATKASKRSKHKLHRILKKSGLTVPMSMSRAQKDLFNATVQEQVGLIRSIPQKYLGEVQGMVMRSVTTGRDLGPLAKDLRKQYGVTKRRAALIARDQNNKATATLTRARQVDLGITEAIWLHSHAGKEPRPTHVKMDGKRYKTAEGMYDPDPKVRRHIFPGELINCRCVSRSFIPGFS